MPKDPPRTAASARPPRTPARAVAGALTAARTAEAALRREAEALLAIVEQRKKGLAVDFYELGRALTELLDRKLYTVVGFPTFAAMVEGRRLMSRALAWRLVAIYRSLPKGLAAKLGPEKAFEWLGVLKLEAGPGATPADVQRLAAARTQAEGRPVTGFSRNELAALREKTKARLDAARTDPGAADAHRTARALAQHLRHLGAGDARVTARWTRGGTWRIRADLPIAAAKKLAEGAA
jgi:hypothetical protein